MMGKKTLSVYRQEIQAAIAASGQDLGAWLDQELHTHQRNPQADQREIETLLLLRDALAAARRKPAKPPRGRARSRS